jgi:hypothetical protein
VMLPYQFQTPFQNCALYLQKTLVENSVPFDLQFRAGPTPYWKFDVFEITDPQGNLTERGTQISELFFGWRNLNPKTAQGKN